MQSAGFEALASATPLVTSPTRVLRDYFDTAALYAEPDGDDIARQVESALSARHDLQDRMGVLRAVKLDEQRRSFAEVEELIGSQTPHMRIDGGR